MTLVLVRHARAGKRERWRGDDRLRPLDAKGMGQAEALAMLLRGQAPERIVSSPFVRCVQTVEPLAAELGLDVEERAELGEERQATEGVPLVLALGSERAVVCCHGGLPEALVGVRLKKGGALVLEPAGPGLRVVEALL
jgi:8-oxo-dGTP diphosphatase